MSELDLNDVAVFVRVVERAGFAKAARELGVPTSTLSRAVARLESATGTRLVHRNTRSVTPTSEGQSFYSEVAPAVLALRNAARGVEGTEKEPRGRLRISAPNDIGATVLAALVPAFTERYPQVEVAVELSQRTVNLVHEGYDLALRISAKLDDSSLVARKAGELEAELYASPGYLSRWGAPANVAALDEHGCVLFRPDKGATTWRLQGPEGLVERRVRGRIGGDDFLFVRAATLNGAGIALLPRMVAADDVASGRLVRVLPQYAVRGSILYVVYAAARTVPAKIAAFRDLVLSSCAVTGARGGAPPARAALPPPAERAGRARAKRTG
ncbi:MAG TPA: LysR family transcriptional regulator [Polyangiaceae bacterium]|nr:LysR family transcriptional regulator [Polyangiaceae bacterium]